MTGTLPTTWRGRRRATLPSAGRRAPTPPRVGAARWAGGHLPRIIGALTPSTSEDHICEAFHKVSGQPVSQKISDSTIRRLSVYLRLLEDLEKAGTATVSSGEMARRSGTTAAQIRKDLSLFGSFGKRGMGYAVAELAQSLRRILGLSRPWRVALIGAGRIGSALFAYPNFASRGFHIVAVVDNDPEKVGKRWGSVTIRPESELEGTIREENVDIVVLAVPAHAVQDVVDRVVRAGVRGILNFAPMPLKVPRHVRIKDVNLVIELEALTYALIKETELNEAG